MNSGSCSQTSSPWKCPIVVVPHSQMISKNNCENMIESKRTEFQGKIHQEIEFEMLAIFQLVWDHV